MKIPDFNIEQLAPPGGGRAPDLRVEKPDGFGELGNAFQQTGQAVDKIIAEKDRVDKQAVATDVANAMAQLETESTNALHGNPRGVADGTTPDDAFNGGGQDTGFLGLRGKAAAEASTSTFENLDDTRAKIAKGLNDPRAQDIFNLHAGQLMRQNQTIIEGHVKQQNEVAAEDSLKNLQDAAVHAAAMDPDLDLAARLRIANVAGVAYGMGRGKDFEERVVRDTAQRVTVARLDTLLAAADVADSNGDSATSKSDRDTAARIFDDNKASLGEHLPRYDLLIGKAKAATKKQDLQDAADGVATGLITQYTDPISGKVDEAKVLQDIATDVPSRPERDEIRKRVNDLIVRQNQIFDQNTKGLVAQGVSVYNASGSASSMPAELKQRLNSWPDPRGPELLERLIKQDDSALERQERHSRIRANDAAARREQRDIDTMAKNDWEDALAKDPNASLDEFKALHQDVSSVMGSAFAPMQSKAINQTENGLRAARNAFVQAATDGADGVIAVKVGSRQDKDAAALEEKDYRARAGLAYDNLLEEKKGAPPTEKEISILKGRVLLDYMSSANAPGSTLPSVVPRTPDAAKRVGETISRDLNAKTPSPKTWTNDQKKKAADTLKHRGLPVTDQNIQTMLQIVHGSKNTLPQQAPAAIPSTVQDLEDAGDEYGLDLTEPPPQNAKLDKMMRKVR